MTLSDLPSLAGVYERDIDFLLLEELHAEPAFVRWVASQVLQQPMDHIDPLAGPWHSVCHPVLGESDLAVLVRVDKTTVALLIENKISAEAQPTQGTRYTQRGEALRTDGACDDFRTCILAPSSYLDTDPEAAAYDTQLSYEAIHEWFRMNHPQTARTTWKLGLLQEAIAPNPRNSHKDFDERVTRFLQEYWQFAQTKYPHLRIRKMERPSAHAPWQEFRPPQLNSPTMQLYHSFYQSNSKHYVYLHFSGWGPRLPQLKAANPLPEDVSWVLRGNGKNLWLRIHVPPVSTTQPFAEQEATVDAALSAAARLADLLPSLQLDAGQTAR